MSPDMGRRSMGRVKITLVMLGAVAAGAAFGATKSGGAGMLRADAGNAAQVARGKQVYAAQCAACHGANLEGQPNWRERRPDGKLPAPPHDATGHTWHHPDDQLFFITKQGTQAIAGPGYKTDMRGFGGVLSDEEIWASLAYIKSNWPADIRARHEHMNAMQRSTGMPKVSPPGK